MIMTFEELQELAKRPGVSDECAKLAAVSMLFFETIVPEGDDSIPRVVFLKQGQLGIMGTQFIEKYNGADKDAWAEMLNNLRTNCEAVVFSHEAWFSQYEGKHSTSDWQDLPRPSEDLNRKEAAMVTLYIHERSIHFFAEIHRNPNRLDKWKVMMDSAEDGVKMEGRFA